MKQKAKPRRAERAKEMVNDDIVYAKKIIYKTRIYFYKKDKVAHEERKKK